MKVSLKAARVNARFSQAEVARILRKSKQTLVNWENGKTEIDKANFEMLCQIYHCQMDDIFLL